MQATSLTLRVTMWQRPGSNSFRHGSAAVEFAVILPLLLTLLIGVWEIGRFIQLQQIMSNAARDGARLASQGVIMNTNGSITDITTSAGAPSINTSTSGSPQGAGGPNVTTTVSNYLYAAGITNQSGLQVSFQFIDGDTSLTDPYQGVKNQHYIVSVTMPYANLRWTNLSLINPTLIGGQCTWQMLVDSPFTVNPVLPGWSP
jgi:Flp pilus assembly protein TadG